MPGKPLPAELNRDGLDQKLDEAFGPIGPPKTLAPPDRTPQSSFDLAMAQVQAELPRVAKGETAKVEKEGRFLYSYQYADLTDVSEAVLPILAKHGLSFRCMPKTRDGRLVMEYRLRHVDGGEEAGDVPLPDRADPQVIGSAMTYWRRYVLCAVTGLAPGGDDDGTAAKDASKRGERMSDASTLSIPPDKTEALVAALEPQALTPLDQYPALWATVVDYRAGAKPSPVQLAGGESLSWADLFGFSLAQRVEAIGTRSALKALYEEAKAVGAPRLPWTYRGMTLAERFKARGKALAEAAEQERRVLEHAVASAETLEQLDCLAARIDAVRAEIDKAAGDALDTFFGERADALARKEGKGSADEAAPAEVPTNRHGELWEYVWSYAESVLDTRANLDGAFERGEVTADQHAQLVDLLGSRPESEPPGQPIEAQPLIWQARQARNADDLDYLRDIVNADGADTDGSTLTAIEARDVYAAISARRAELAGDRYK